MVDRPHTLERRSHLLAERIKSRVRMIADSITPKGERIPYTVQMSKAEALQFWQKNINTPTGKRLLEQMPPLDQLELQQALFHATQEVEDGLT